MQEFATTANGRRFLNDVNRIAAALEQLAKVPLSFNDGGPRLMTDLDLAAIKVALDMKYAQEHADRLLALVKGTR